MESGIVLVVQDPGTCSTGMNETGTASLSLEITIDGLYGIRPVAWKAERMVDDLNVD